MLNKTQKKKTETECTTVEIVWTKRSQLLNNSAREFEKLSFQSSKI